MASFIDALSPAREWLDPEAALAPLTTGEMAADSWAKVGTTIGVWILLPLTIGLVRLLRREVS